MSEYEHGVIDLHGFKIVFGSYPLHAFIPDASSGGYKADIDISDYGFMGELWSLVGPKYPNGHPYVSTGSVAINKITLLADVNISGAYAQWVVMGETSG